MKDKKPKKQLYRFYTEDHVTAKIKKIKNQKRSMFIREAIMEKELSTAYTS